MVALPCAAINALVANVCVTGVCDGGGWRRCWMFCSKPQLSFRWESGIHSTTLQLPPRQCRPRCGQSWGHVGWERWAVLKPPIACGSSSCRVGFVLRRQRSMRWEDNTSEKVRGDRAVGPYFGVAISLGWGHLPSDRVASLLLYPNQVKRSHWSLIVLCSVFGWLTPLRKFSLANWEWIACRTGMIPNLHVCKVMQDFNAERVYICCVPGTLPPHDCG